MTRSFHGIESPPNPERFTEVLDRHLHHLPPAPAQKTAHDTKIETDLTESYQNFILKRSVSCRHARRPTNLRQPLCIIRHLSRSSSPHAR